MVVFGLTGDVITNASDNGVADGENAESGLPGEVWQDAIVEPTAGSGFNVTDEWRGSSFAGDGYEKVKVIRHAAGSEELAVSFTDDASDIFIEAGGKVGGDHGLAIFGGEDDVLVEGGEGLGHGGHLEVGEMKRYKRSIRVCIFRSPLQGLTGFNSYVSRGSAALHPWLLT